MKVTVLGSGSWGSALAKVLSDKGHRVTLWGRRPELAAQIEETRENGTFLPGARFADTLARMDDDSSIFTRYYGEFHGLPVVNHCPGAPIARRLLAEGWQLCSG